MIFNSFEFFIFLEVAFLLYWFAFGKSLKWQNVFLVVASYVFYAWWDWRFAFLLAGVSSAAYGIGKAIHSNACDQKKAKLLSGLNIGIAVLILFVFKYYNFFADSFAKIFLGGQSDKLLLDLALPVGISFFLFKSMSYTIDIYKGKIVPTDKITQVFAYIGFFPQLLAGPIARPGDLLPQIASKRTFDYDQAVDGCRQFLWGLFKKVVVADNCAVYVNNVFSSYPTQSGSTLLLAAVLYSFQIYADFSGYSDMAIGTGNLFGFSSKKNFDFPYFSRNIAEFWRKWHISLTSWFRDYIYIPMGGSRVGKFRIILNTLVVFLVSGLWHGANWTFIIWGAYHGLLFIPGILFGWNKKYKEPIASNRALPSLKEFGMMLGTFLLAMFGWIIFRAESIGMVGEYLQGMFASDFLSIPFLYVGTKKAIAAALLMIAVEWPSRKREYGISRIVNFPKVFRITSLYVLIFLILEFAQGSQSFIYFQF